MAAHHVAQNLFAVISLLEVMATFVARFIFIDLEHFGQIVQLQANRTLHGEVHQIVVHEGDPVFQAVSHAEFIFHHEQTVQKCLSLEVKTMVDVVLWTVEHVVVVCEHIAKDIASPNAFDIIGYWGEHPFEQSVVYQTLPVMIVLIYILLEILAVGGTVIAPGVTTKKFITTTARKYYFDEFAGQFCGVVIGVALSHSGLFKMMGKLRQAALHVTGFEHHFIVFSHEACRHGFRFGAFVIREFDT